MIVISEKLVTVTVQELPALMSSVAIRAFMSLASTELIESTTALALHMPCMAAQSDETVIEYSAITSTPPVRLRAARAPAKRRRATDRVTSMMLDGTWANAATL